MWARPQPKNSGVCYSDGVGAVQNADWADDLLSVSGEPQLSGLVETYILTLELQCFSHLRPKFIVIRGTAILGLRPSMQE
jgi:hypothetical protein